MCFTLIPKHSDVILHNAKPMTLDVPNTETYIKEFNDALNNGTTVEFEGVHYYVDLPL